ncbi:MAG: hypothetical protein Q8J78_00485 [Moraxellaceae bacterium]|nr:hypothetical protein [Moraxellaceae bacterium]
MENRTSDTPVRRVALGDLSPEHRRVIEQTALEEIAQFRADGDPAAIERLAAAGRLQDWPTDEGRILANLVSDAQVAIAERLRQARAILSLFGGLGRAHKLAVREVAGRPDMAG